MKKPSDTMKKPPNSKPKANISKIKFAGADGAIVYKPLTTEISRSESGERMTTVSFDKPFVNPMVYSADEIFGNAERCHGTLVDSLPWYFILPWLQNEPPEIESFWAKFDTPKAMQERRRAVSGTKFVNYSEERVVIGLAKEYLGLVWPQWVISPSDSPPLLTEVYPPGSAPNAALRDQILQKLGTWVVKTVATDHEAAARMHRLLKSPNAGDDPKGDQLSFNGKIFEAFVALVATERKLPTKNIVRRSAGMGGEQKDLTAASEAFRDLGLGGLPQG